MPQLYLNNFTTQLIASVKSAPATANPASELDYGVLRVSDGAAGTLINPPSGSWYVLTAFKRAGTAESDYEILRVTGVDNSVVGECRLTVLRGQEGTTPKAYVAGDLVELRLTAGGISQYAQTTDPRMSDPRAPTGAAGGVLAGSYPNPGFAQPMATVAQMEGRVEKVAGKGLSANDYTNADVAKLAGVAEQATKNAPDSQLRDRSTHTGVQAISTVTDLQATLDAKEPGIAAGTAAQYWRGDKTWRDFAAEVRATVLTGLSTASNTAIVAADTVLAALGKLQAQISAHFGAGGGAHAAATSDTSGFLAAADKAKLDGVTAGATANATDAQLRDRGTHTGVQAIGTVSGLQAALDSKQPAASLGEGAAAAVHAAPLKAAPADQDEFALLDSASAWSLKRLTWANIKSALSGLFLLKIGGQVTGNIEAYTSGALDSRKSEWRLMRTDGGSAEGLVALAMRGEGANGYYGRASIYLGSGDYYNAPILEAVRISTLEGLLSLTGPIGYGAGARGTVTQATSKTTGVTLNKPSGKIITHGGSLPAGATASFQFQNSFIGPGDVLVLSVGWPDSYDPSYYSVRAAPYQANSGFALISLKNEGGQSFGHEVVINFAVIKGGAS